MTIGIGGWSFHRAFRDGRLTILDFPRLAAGEFGVSVIELNSPFFESIEEDWLNQVRARADEAGVRIVHIAVDDGEMDLAATDDDKRRASVDRARKWFAVSKVLGNGAFRVNTGGSTPPTPDQIAASLESFRELSADAERNRIAVTIENHGGASADCDLIVRFMDEIAGPWVRTCPDFGNFPADCDPLEEIAKIIPYAAVVHAKMNVFDDQGNATDVDVPAIVDLLKNADFAGPYLIEFEGDLDEYEGTRKAVALLRRLL